MTTDQGFPADRELIESYYDDRSTPNEKDLLHQRDVLAARNPETPEWVLRKVMESASWEVLGGLAANRACPHDLFPEILERCDSFGTSAAGREAANVVRRSLAANPFASTEVSNICDQIVRIQAHFLHGYIYFVSMPGFF